MRRVLLVLVHVRDQAVFAEHAAWHCNRLSEVVLVGGGAARAVRLIGAGAAHGAAERDLRLLIVGLHARVDCRLCENGRGRHCLFLF